MTSPTASAGTGRVVGTPLELTVLGGPTVVLDLAGLRLITDPTFDPPGDYPVGERRLTKTQPSSWTPAEVGDVDVVLLSHDQHPDNLDRAGRTFLSEAPLVLSTASAATRLGGTVRALGAWETVDVPGTDGRALQITGVPARHGPEGTEHLTGEVTGFVLHGDDLPTVYVSGDNASLDLVAEIAGRFPKIDVAVLFAGGARTPLLGDRFLTLSSAMAAQAARLLASPSVVVVHTEGWSHFTENAATVPDAFAAEGIADVLVPAPFGRTVRLG
ncbi:MBL fold metallo-hydrolase [Intrasporangium oryzae]|uniref:MBL fold metallo-hydrolase n=1 Tax=Intrasporangium oryzae TaxID=412687 RepID=UPI0005540F19|nr:MBL fold metallo-hydrolase [Intrasporangium oryzae]